jgi:hypothetical protein
MAVIVRAAPSRPLAGCRCQGIAPLSSPRRLDKQPPPRRLRMASPLPPLPQNVDCCVGCRPDGDGNDGDGDGNSDGDGVGVGDGDGYGKGDCDGDGEGESNVNGNVPKNFEAAKSLAEMQYCQFWQQEGMQPDVLHPCPLVAIIGDWIAQRWGLLPKPVGGRVC